MAVIKKRAVARRTPELILETPPLNLLNGKFRRVAKVRHEGDEGGDYEGLYRMELRLLEDESPIKRVELQLVNLESGRPGSRIVLPVLFWKMLEENLPDFMAEVIGELDRRGESSAKFKRRADGPA